MSFTHPAHAPFVLLFLLFTLVLLVANWRRGRAS